MFFDHFREKIENLETRMKNFKEKIENQFSLIWTKNLSKSL